MSGSVPLSDVPEQFLDRNAWSINDRDNRSLGRTDGIGQDAIGAGSGISAAFTNIEARWKQ
jgi:hypothetical protein